MKDEVKIGEKKFPASKIPMLKVNDGNTPSLYQSYSKDRCANGPEGITNSKLPKMIKPILKLNAPKPPTVPKTHKKEGSGNGDQIEEIIEIVHEELKGVRKKKSPRIDQHITEEIITP